MPRACVWEVVAVSLDIGPPLSVEGIELGDKADEFELRYRLAIASLGDELTILGWPAGKENKDPGFALIGLAQFADFAKRRGWPLPPRFPVAPVDASQKRASSADDQAPGKRERETLLTIIAGLVGEERLQHTTTEAKRIEAKLVNMGVDEPKERTISIHLDRAKAVLDGRKR